MSTCTTTTSDVPKASSLVEYGVLVLNTNDIEEKVRLTYEADSLYKEKRITATPTTSNIQVPDHPQRPTHLQTVLPQHAPKRGSGTLANRINLLHSLCHMESYAIDLSWDILSRFYKNDYMTLPDSFYEEWLKVAHDEAKHFSWLSNRLKELGSSYGSVPVHDGLWQSATDTSHDLLARLAILHMVHEARGLDVTPKNIERLRCSQDPESANLLTSIYEEEITHVTTGVTQFKYICENDEKKHNPNLDDQQLHDRVLNRFYDIVRKNFRGVLNSNFNHEAREKAGMTREWYEPLVHRVISL
jgi:uncharacterized ferritin-like protein (DUF455 family)